jgi:hypothetical protein
MVVDIITINKLSVKAGLPSLVEKYDIEIILNLMQPWIY